jgi:hypothetical protein
VWRNKRTLDDDDRVFLYCYGKECGEDAAEWGATVTGSFPASAVPLMPPEPAPVHEHEVAGRTNEWKADRATSLGERSSQWRAVAATLGVIARAQLTSIEGLVPVLACLPGPTGVVFSAVEAAQYVQSENYIMAGVVVGAVALGGGLGKFAAKEAASGVRVTEEGMQILRGHLEQFGSHPPNAAMIQRLESALGVRVTGADANFYLHEISEATMMGRGMPYEAAHAAAIEKYGVSPFSLFAPEVIQAMPEYFNSAWRSFWGLP